MTIFGILAVVLANIGMYVCGYHDGSVAQRARIRHEGRRLKREEQRRMLAAANYERGMKKIRQIQSGQ